MKFLEKFEDLDLTRELAGVRLPKLTIDTKYYQEIGLSPKVSNAEFLKGLAQKGYKELLKSGKIDKLKSQDYGVRVKQELATFEKLNFVDYVLIVWDVIKFCEENDIPTGIGRGSVCGSLVFYLIGVTGIDPLKYELYFERFVSEARAKSQVIDGILYIDGSLLMDVDLDIDYLRRHEVVKHLDQKYPNRTAKIINLSTLTGKNLIKECGKVVGGKNEFEMTQIADMIPQIFGDVQDIEEIYEKDPKFKTWCDNNKEIYEIALKLRYLNKNKSVHASGIVISYDELSDSCPLELSKDGELVAAFDMKDVAQFCIKLDILGLKTLTILDSICKVVGIKMKDINFEDPVIYKYLQEFDNTYGIFQLEGHTGEKVTRWVKPENIEELAGVNALARPAALHSVKDYIKNKENDSFEVIHPAFEEILKKTHGLPLYQEQLMKMANAIGFTLEESEVIRRIVGKKDRDAVKAWEDKIYSKCKENNFPEEVGKWLWDVLNKSKDYSFNKSHAIAYSALAGMTIFLKMNYPKEFFFASLNIITQSNDPDKNEKISKICKELKTYGIPLLPPDIKNSKSDFSLEKNGIRYGLGSVKGVSDAAIIHLEKFAPDFANKFELFESIKQAGINLGVLCALIQAGAMGNFGISRSRLVLEAQLWSLLKPSEKAYCLAYGQENNFNLTEMLRKINDWTDQAGKKIARATRHNTIKNNYIKKGYGLIYDQNRKYEEFANWWYEKTLLGFNYSNDLQSIFIKSCPELMKIEEFNNIEQKSIGTFMGVVTDFRDATSKNKNRYTRVTFEDGTGSLTAMAFGDIRARLMSDKRMPKIGGVAVFRGKKWENLLSLEEISVQDHKIYMKLADLKNNEEE